MLVRVASCAVIALTPFLCQAQAPALLSTIPARHSLTGSTTEPITLFFSQPVVNPIGIQINSEQVQGKRTGTFRGAGTRQIAFQPTQSFMAGERISVTVPASVSTPAQVVEFRAAAGRGAAVFSAPITVGPPPSAQPTMITAGDVDHDGDMDLLVGESGSVRLCLNDGNGQFTPQASSVATSGLADDLRLADFNGDGNLDLLVSNKRDPAVTLSLGTSQGTFLTQTNLLPALFTVQVVTGDFNADGLTDVVAVEVEGNGNVLRLLPGTPNGQLVPTYSSVITLNARDVGVADMDEDGDLDLLIVTDVTLGVYLNDGTGRFTAGQTQAVNPLSATLTVGDFTGDGHVDVVCSSYQTSNVSLVPGTGTGGLQPMQNIVAVSRTLYVSSGDMDGDADLDLLVTNDRGFTQVLLNDGRGHFAAASAILIGFEGFTMANVADLNGDGLLDVYTGHGVVNVTMPHGIDIFFNQPAIVTSSARPAIPLDFAVYPNPAHAQFTVRLPVSSSLATIELRDALGRLIQTLTVPSSGGDELVSLAGVVPGIYSVHFHTATRHEVLRVQVE